MKYYDVVVEGLSPILMHQYKGDSEAKRIKEIQNDREQAEASTYRMDGEDSDSNLAAPSVWFIGCIRESFISSAGKKEKTSVANEVTPSIATVEYMIDLGVKEFTISKKVIPVKKMGKIAAQSIVIRPMLEKWNCSFTLQSSLDRTSKQLQAEVERAGKYQGVGAGRKLGYGRFKVVSFTEVNE